MCWRWPRSSSPPFLDGIDGRLARLLKGTSRFGAELDSLADFVNFGVAPALILYFWGLHELKSAGWIAAMVFAICAGLRLARFNVMLDDPDRPAWASNFFVGMPAPAGAITVLLPIYAALLGLPRSEVLTWLTLVYTLGIASLMVSRLPVFSGKRVGTRVPPEMVGPAVVVAVLFFALLIAYPWIMLTAGTLAYLGGLPFGWLSYRGYEQRSRESRAAAPRRHRRSPPRRSASSRPPITKIVRRASIEPYRRRLRSSSRETKHACCAPHLPGLDHGVARGSGRHASRASPTRRNSRSSCITRSPRCRARTTSFWRRGRAKSRRNRAAASASICFPRCSSAARRPICSTRRATGSSILAWAQPSKTPGRFPKIEAFELPFVPSRRALVSSKAVEDFAARQPGRRIPRGSSDLLLVLRPRRVAHHPAGPHRRGNSGLAAARADPIRRRSGACARCDRRADAERAAAAGDQPTRGRRLHRSVGHGADASSSTICSRRTPNFPICR